MLSVRQLQVRYGSHQALRGVSLEVAPSEIVAVLGRNGSGRSTLARALMGLVPAQGEVLWQGQPVLGRPAHELALQGLGYVPESRDAFATLTVHQNLLLGLKPGAPPQKLAAAYDMFPALRERRAALAGVLSGGEQQMLSLARTLLGEPRLLIVDEPTEGLAPHWLEVVAQALRALRAQGVGVLLIEQRLSVALAVADRVLLMGRGEIVFSGTPGQLQADPQRRREWLEP